MITRDFFLHCTSLHPRLGLNNRSLSVLLLAGLLLIMQGLLTQPAFAASELMVSPTRVVFEDRTRSATVTLANTGDATGRYRVTFIQRQMTESGNLAEVKEGTPGKYVDDLVRFSPREVTLPPGQSQVVRLLLRKKSSLQDGEYRSHMLFQSLPDPNATSIQTLTDKSGDTLQVQLIPIVGISIPVIVRQGSLQATGSLSNIQLQPAKDSKQPAQLGLSLKREGDRSLYGDFRVMFTPDGGKPVMVSQANGLALYTPNAQRKVSLTLQVPAGVQLKRGELHVTYLESGQDAGSGLIAEGRLRLP